MSIDVDALLRAGGFTPNAGVVLVRTARYSVVSSSSSWSPASAPGSKIEEHKIAHRPLKVAILELVPFPGCATSELPELCDAVCALARNGIVRWIGCRSVAAGFGFHKLVAGVVVDPSCVSLDELLEHITTHLERIHSVDVSAVSEDKENV